MVIILRTHQISLHKNNSHDLHRVINHSLVIAINIAKEVHSNIIMHCDAMICTYSNVITYCDITMDIPDVIMSHVRLK